jgi:hypothetical protein
MAARVAKAAKDAKEGRKMTQRVAAKVKKADQQLEEALRKLNGINNKTPGRTSKKSGIDVGKDRVKKGSKAKVQKGAIYGTAGTGAVGAGYMATKDNDYSTANVDLKSGKGLPVADMSRSVEVRGTSKGMRYFQDGKEVRMPKK